MVHSHSIRSGKRLPCQGVLLTSEALHRDHASLASSLQVHVDIAETELLRIVNMGNLLSPVMVALMGNSAVLHGQPAEFVSSREGAGERMDPVRFRHGMARGPFYSVS